MSTGSPFVAAMVQMRTGLLPGPSLEQATALIRQPSDVRTSCTDLAPRPVNGSPSSTPSLA